MFIWRNNCQDYNQQRCQVQRRRRQQQRPCQRPRCTPGAFVRTLEASARWPIRAPYGHILIFARTMLFELSAEFAAPSLFAAGLIPVNAAPPIFIDIFGSITVDDSSEDVITVTFPAPVHPLVDAFLFHFFMIPMAVEKLLQTAAAAASLFYYFVCKLVEIVV